MSAKRRRRIGRKPGQLVVWPDIVHSRIDSSGAGGSNVTKLDTDDVMTIPVVERAPGFPERNPHFKKRIDLAARVFSIVDRVTRERSRESTRTRPAISLAPGARLLVVFPYLFSRRTIEQTFTPALLDMRLEYFDALAEKRVWLARAVYSRWVLGLVETVLLSWFVSLAKKIRAFWKIVG